MEIVPDFGVGRQHLPGMLCCPKISEEERISAFYTTVGACVLWGSGCWTPPVNTQQLVSVQENRRLPCVLCGRKKSDSGLVAQGDGGDSRLGGTLDPKNRTPPRGSGGAVA